MSNIIEQELTEQERADDLQRDQDAADELSRAHEARQQVEDFAASSRFSTDFAGAVRDYVRDNRAYMPADADAQDYLDHYDTNREAMATDDCDHGYPALTDEQRARFLMIADEQSAADGGMGPIERSARAGGPTPTYYYLVYMPRGFANEVAVLAFGSKQERDDRRNALADDADAVIVGAHDPLFQGALRSFRRRLSEVNRESLRQYTPVEFNAMGEYGAAKVRRP